MSADQPESRTHLLVNARLRIPLSEFEWTYARSSGPGGQNVNKVNSKAVMRWNFALTPSLPPAIRERFASKYGTRITEEGDLVMSSEEYRDQKRNQEACLEKLSEMLRSVAVAPKVRKPTKPSAGSQRRRLADKKQRQETKQSRRSPGLE